LVSADVEKLAAVVIDCGYHLYREVGPGLLESVYETVLANRLVRGGIRVERQKSIPVRIDGINFGDGFRADLIVEGRLLVELKSIEKLAPLHTKQVLTYLRLMNMPLGLLMNFGSEIYRDGVKRVMNNHVKPEE
jgi:GxxExxY protein